MNTEQKAFERVTRFAEDSQRKISVLLEGYIKLTELLGKTPANPDMSKAEVSEIVSGTMEKFNS